MTGISLKATESVEGLVKSLRLALTGDGQPMEIEAKIAGAGRVEKASQNLTKEDVNSIIKSDDIFKES